MIGCEGLGKQYGKRWLFRNVSFRAEVGDCIVVMGANGSGKSTMLKILAGLIPPTTGTCIRPDDRRTGIGFSALDQAVYPSLSVREHLELAADMRGCEARIDEVLAEVGFEFASETLGGVLSTGMRARLKLALAIQARPVVAILDEPGAGLDEQGREIVARIVEIYRHQTAFIIATNDPLERRFATHELTLAP